MIANSPKDLPFSGASAWQDSPDGLIGANPFQSQNLAESMRRGAYTMSLAPSLAQPELFELLQTRLSAQKLRGRGGAAFPTLSKMRSVMAASASSDQIPAVLANGAEGEPLSFKDRYLLRYRPHLVIDGTLLAAGAIGARQVFFYIADEIARESVRRALLEVCGHLSTPIDVQMVAAQDTYVAGEETAAVRAIASGVARPLDKPPRPYQRGVNGVPTLVLNVETLAWLGLSLGESQDAAPRFLATISGEDIAPVLYELPIGLPLGEVRKLVGHRIEQDVNILAGGFFGGIIPCRDSIALDYSEFQTLDSSLGCGALYFLRASTCPIKIAADVAAYFTDNNARQCMSCIYSTRTVAETLASLGGRSAESAAVKARLRRWSSSLPGTGACAVPDGVATLLCTLHRYYSARLSEHLDFGCTQCAEVRGEKRWHSLRLSVAKPLSLSK